jgi:hypothetical protein
MTLEVYRWLCSCEVVVPERRFRIPPNRPFLSVGLAPEAVQQCPLDECHLCTAQFTAQLNESRGAEGNLETKGYIRLLSDPQSYPSAVNKQITLHSTPAHQHPHTMRPALIPLVFAVAALATPVARDNPVSLVSRAWRKLTADPLRACPRTRAQGHGGCPPVEPRRLGD